MAELQIIITGENQSGAAFASLKKDAGDVAQGFDTAKEKGGGFFSGLLQTAGGFLAANVLGNIAGQVTGFVTDGIAAAQDTAKLMASTEQTIKTMGNAAGRSAQEVADMATALSDAAGKSLFGDDQIQQSENLLLTFGNIKGAVFDTATSLTVDLAAALGGAPKDQAMMLGKALNDPIKGISALGKAGLTFTEEQKATIRAMQESGDMAGAQGIILAELTKQVGGQAEAQAKAAGGMVQFKARMGEVSESIGAALLPALNMIGGMLSNTVAPAIEDAAAWLGQKLPIAIDKAATFWNTILAPALKLVWDFLKTNLIPIIDELVKWLNDELPPVIEQLADYWENTLEPALEKVWAFIQQNVIPIIDTLVKVAFAILKEDIKILAALWVNVLWPALQKVWEFIKNNVIPIIADLIVWVKDNLPPAIAALAKLWNETLLPALTAIWNFIDTKLLPVLKAIADVISAALTLAINVVVGVIKKDFIPAFESIYNFVNDKILPRLKDLTNFLSLTLGPIIATFGTILAPVVQYFSDLLSNIQGVVSWLETLARKINEIHIPSWAGGGDGDGGDGPTPPGNATGTKNWRGGLTMVGEFGPELVSLPRGSQIHTNSDSRAMIGGGDTYIFHFGDDVSSYDQARLERETRSAMRSAGRRADYRMRTGG